MERGVGMLAEVSVEIVQEWAVKQRRASGAGKRRDGTGGLSLRQDFFDESQADRKTVGDVLTRAFVSIRGVQNSLAKIEREGFHASQFTLSFGLCK